MTRYKRRATRNETMCELIAEVRALRAEIAALGAERVQIVPMPYPQPYPVYPVHPVYPAAPQSQPYPWNPTYWTTTGMSIVGDTCNTFGSSLTSGSGAPTTLTYNAGD